MSLAENIALVDQLKVELDGLRPLSKNAKDVLWNKLRLEWNYNSNHIEGNTLTYGETMLLLLHDKTTGDHEKREYDEMQAHDVAISLVKEWSKEDRQLAEADIKNLNKIILVKSFWKEAITPDGQPTRRLIRVGDYKEFPNHVRLKNGEIFKYASPEETSRLMQELVDWFNLAKDIHPVILAAELHYRFIRIHPFDDGNGRIARLLINYVLMRYGYTPTIIKSVDKENYLTALQKADAGDRQAFIDYVAEQTKWSLQLEIKAAKGEDLEEPDDLDKEIALLNNAIKNEAKLIQKGTTSVIHATIEENIFPLIDILLKKLDPLKEIFFDVSISANWGRHEKDWNDTYVSTLSSQSLQIWLDRMKGANTGIRKFNYIYHLRGLKKTIEAHNIKIILEITFNDYNYIIKTSADSASKIYPYGKKIERAELEEIVKNILRNTITRIKSIE